MNVRRDDFIKFVGDFMDTDESVGWNCYYKFCKKLLEKFGSKDAYRLEMMLFEDPYENYDDFLETTKMREGCIYHKTDLS